MNILKHTGEYCILLKTVFSKPEKRSVFISSILKEIHKLGISSIGIVMIISIFMGAVIALQTALNLNNPLLPKYLIGFTTRESMILEFSSTIVALILAGKVGSNIASEIGTMRISEQIDALDTMGINSASYLILPKIIAFVFTTPFLYIISVFIGILGGFFVSQFFNLLNLSEFIYGLRFNFVPYYLLFSTIKSIVFAFIITTVPSYYGYTVKGGALEVGKASTKGVVNSTILILLSNLLLTQLLLK